MYRLLEWCRAKLKDSKTFGEQSSTEPVMHWIEAARRQTPVLFVGSGFSLNAKPKASAPKTSKMMTWSELTDLLLVGEERNAPSNDFLWTAEKYRRHFGESALYQKICEAVPDDRVEPGDEHKELTNINWHAVLTLNFDTLLERALFPGGAPGSRSIYRQEQLPSAFTDRRTDRRAPVIHLHGHIAHSESIVLTLEDFRRYPQEKSAFLTIARQLLLQHPVLFLGFGASDPNFVAWTGWIRDTIGDRSPPWLRLDLSNDVGMNAYWAPRLQTVTYQKEKLVEVLKFFRQALEELQPSEDAFADYLCEAAGLVENEASHESLFQGVVRELDAFDNGYEVDLGNISGADLTNKLLEAGLRNAGREKTELETLKCKLEAYHGEFARIITQRDGPLTGKIKGLKIELREALAENFSIWLLASVKLLGPSVSPWGHSDLRFDAIEELKVLAEKTEKGRELPEVLGSLALLLLQELHAKVSAPLLSETAREELGISHLLLGNDFSRKWSARLEQLNAMLQNPKPVERPMTAQDYRKNGYCFAMQGMQEASVDAYQRAAERSAEEGEPLIIQKRTRQSLLYSIDVSRFDPVDAEESETRRNSVCEQVKELDEDTWRIERKMKEDTDRHRKTEFEDLSKVYFESAAADPNLSQVMRFGTFDFRKALDFHERYFFSPGYCQTQAQRFATFAWSRGELAVAARTFSKYGLSKELETRCTSLLEAPRSHKLDSQVFDELFKASDWPAQTATKVAALTKLVEEVETRTPKQLLDHSLEAVKALVGKEHTFSGRTLVPEQQAILLGLAAANYCTWAEFDEWRKALTNLGAKRTFGFQGEGWLQLRLERWKEDLENEKSTEFWDFLFTQAKHLPIPGSESRVYNLMLSNKLIPPAESLVWKEIKQWSKAPKNDADEWLRTACAFHIADSKKRPAKMRGASRRKRADTIKQLIATSKGKPFPELLLAWSLAVHGSDHSARLRSTDIQFAKELLSNEKLDSNEPRNFNFSLLPQAISRLASSQLLDDVACEQPWFKLLEKHCAKRPVGYAPLFLTPFSKMSLPVRAVLTQKVDHLFHPMGDVGERTLHQLAAVSCFVIANAHSTLSDIPASWFTSTASLTTAVNAQLAAYACNALGWYVHHHQQSLEEQTRETELTTIRKALLAATADGRATVVGAARRALLQVAAIQIKGVKTHITQHPDTQTTLNNLKADARIAVRNCQTTASS